MTSAEKSNAKSQIMKFVGAITIVSVLVAGGFAWWNQSKSSATTNITYSTLSGLKNVKWSSSVTVSFTSDYLTLKSTDIPNHERDTYYAVPNAGVVVPDATTATIAKDPTRAQSVSFKIPLHPKYMTATTNTPLGSIGLMISGSVLFNPYEGDGKTIAMSSNFYIKDSVGNKVWFVDHCSGHPTPMDGQYHYHALSSCVSRQVDKSTGPSHIEGLALDGFPIYGPRDMNGENIPVSALDECNGIFGATTEYPNGIYHYVLPNTTDATSSIRCFHGEVDKSQIQQMPQMGPMPTK